MVRTALCLLVATAAASASGLAGAATAPASEPLVQQSDITYSGAFALPLGMFGSSSFDYGGHALAPYHDPSGKSTMYLEGHAQRPGNVAQVQIPSNFVISSSWSSLPVASVLQNFADITNGNLGAVDPTNQYNPTFVYGLLPYNGRMIVGAANVYSASQQVSHGVAGLTVSSSGFKGWYSVNSSAPARAVGGPMAPIPAEWQSLFGGPALTSLFGVSVVSSTSAGPTATVFNPNSVGSSNPIPGTTVLYYPISNPACGSLHCEATQNVIFNLTAGYGGLAFIPGTRTVLFVGTIGTGPYCYDTAAACNDPYMPDVKGPHAAPYRYQVWAYDANDLVAVKNGTKQTYQPQPYGIWVLNGMPNSSTAFIKGAAFDPVTGNLYITQDYGPSPRVEVYHINVSGASSTPPPTSTTPDPPTSVTVN